MSNRRDRVEQHVHDVAGYVQPACSGRERHTHCFETVSSEAIPWKDSHVHEVKFETDIVECHCHKFCGRTGPAIPSGFGNHIHVINCHTTCNDGHKHCAFVATDTERPVRC